MSQRPDPWIVDPDDPRAPPQDVWDRMSEEERQRVVDSLPSHFEPARARPPQGDAHTEEVYGAWTALRRYFSRTQRSIYIGTNLPVHYPGEPMFSPDVMAALDTGTHPRPSWRVSQEGMGLGFALDVQVLDSRRENVVLNVERYARLGITEYFVFDRPKLRLTGYRLAPGSTSYQPIVPQHGHFASTVLDLDLVVDAGRLRFYAGDAALPDAGELVGKLESFVDDLETRIEAAEQRAAQEAERAAQEAERAARAESELREALTELERLRRSRG